METKKKIGVITIGQSPRIDLIPEMEAYFDANCEITEVGALDDLSQTEIDQLLPINNEVSYVSRLRNGSYAKMSKRLVAPLIQQRIDELEQTMDTIILLCTGTFKDLQYRKPLLFPDRVLYGIVSGVVDNEKIGVIVPMEEQMDSVGEKWEEFSAEYAVANPYVKDTDFIQPAQKLKNAGVKHIIMDCMGYTQKQKEIVQSVTGIPVILARSVVARVASELS